MNFSPILETLLRHSGWYLNRVSLNWELAEGYTLFPEAESILNGFFGLYIHSTGFGKRIRSEIDFRGTDHPPMYEEYPELGLYPLGETFSAHGSFVIAKSGDFFVCEHVGISRLSFSCINPCSKF